MTRVKIRKPKEIPEQSPPVEQPAVLSSPLTEAKEPITLAPEPELNPQIALTLTDENLVRVLNAQTENINALKADLLAMAQALRSMQDATTSKSRPKNAGIPDIPGQIRANSGGSSPPQGGEPPAWLKPLLPTLLKVGEHFAEGLIGGGPRANPATDTLMRKLAEYQLKKTEQLFDRLITVIDADERGQLYIGKQPPEPAGVPE